MEKKLIENLSLYSGLDEQVFVRELDELLKKYGISSQEINLATLREVLAQEIQDVFVELKKTVEEHSDEDPRPIDICKTN